MRSQSSVLKLVNGLFPEELCSIVSITAPNVTLVRSVHPLKTDGHISVALFATTLTSEVQSRKADVNIFSTLGNVTVVRAVQPWKANEPIVVASGNDTLMREVQYSKAVFSILVALSATTSVMSMHPLKAPFHRNLHFKPTEMLKLAYYDVGLSIFLRELLMKKSNDTFRL